MNYEWRKQEKYSISIIISAHNAAGNLPRLMRCILNQTLSLENMQILLFNNASTDGSEIICKKYAEKYSQIQYIELMDWHSISYVRNLGLNYALGKYVTFFDTDDLWSLNAFEVAVSFLDKYYDKIDAVNANIAFFGQEIGKHNLWFDVPKDYIVDMCTDYKKIAIRCSTFVIKTEVAKAYQFDEIYECSEGTRYINHLLSRKRKFGWMSGVVYYKRIQMDDKENAYSFPEPQRNSLENLVWVTNDLYKVYGDGYDVIIPAIQYLVAYLITLWMEIQVDSSEVRTKDGRDSLYNILSKVDDKYLLECCGADVMLKIEMLAIKYHLDLKDSIRVLRKQMQLLSLRDRQLARTKNNYDVLKQWFLNKNQGKSLLPYFHRFQWHQIAVYGISDLGRFLCEELAETDIVVKYAIDRRADQLEADIPVYTLEKKLPLVDVIVVTASFFFEQIAKDLQGRIECPVVALEDMVYAME